uniref:DUF148 domain-containing protein n=1 Tax=Rhabditophanes sp. KR3021 TaxID=114890 RepID=A0AC35UHR3_9BILA
MIGTIYLVVFLSASVVAFPIGNEAIFSDIQESSPMKSSPDFPPLPEEIASVLPNDANLKINEIIADPALSPDQKHTLIDEIITNLPEEILDKIPTPPELKALPEAIRLQVRKIMRNKNLSITEKRMKLAELMQNNVQGARMKLRMARMRRAASSQNSIYDLEQYKNIGFEGRVFW